MLEIKNIYKRYEFDKVLEDVSMSFPECGFISIVGPSGCGKSTLLHIIGGIDREFQGQLCYDGKNVKHQLHKYRKNHVTFLFQKFHLIMWLRILENIYLSRFFHWQYHQKQEMDISGFDELSMSALSIGQRQRIAYLRARMQKGDILLCDEPTGSLDPTNATKVMEMLKQESKRRLVIVVSHDKKLVDKYSDEIYTIQDGKVINHYHRHRGKRVENCFDKYSRYHFANWKIALQSIKSHRRRTLQLIFGLTLSFLCILMTMSLSQGLEKQIQDYIYTIVPSSGISFQQQNKHNIDSKIIKQMHENLDISRIHLYLDGYENMGLSFQAKRYEESKTLFISDDSSPYQYLQLKHGHFPESDKDIVLSLSTAKHLCEDGDVEKCLNKKVYAWYKHGNKMQSIEFVIKGISANTTSFDTFYQKENAYIHLLKQQADFEDKATLAMAYVKPGVDRHQVMLKLEKEFHQMRFKEVGASTSQHVQDVMYRVKIVLLTFSALAMLSSVFLIGEVMFLNVVQKKKDLAIMHCFGATPIDILKMTGYESIIVVFISQFIGCILYIIMLSVFNHIAKSIMMSELSLFTVQFDMVFKVCLYAWILALISQLIPLLYVLRLNTIDALKS